MIGPELEREPMLIRMMDPNNWTRYWVRIGCAMRDEKTTHTASQKAQIVLDILRKSRPLPRLRPAVVHYFRPWSLAHIRTVNFLLLSG
jgi:squalene cyclase